MADTPASTFAPHLPPGVFAKLRALDDEDRAIAAQLEDPEVVVDHRRVRELSVKRSALAGVVVLTRNFWAIERQAASLRELLRTERDPELLAMAREEMLQLEISASVTIKELLSKLVTADDQRVGSVMLEIRAGTGGDEASLWARDLLEMYERYAAKRGWTFEMLDAVPETAAGGIRSAVVNVRGEGVWTELAFEAGVHSVKRVPATEAQGRIHTSTASVAALPEVEEVSIKIDWARDVQENVTTSQGPGGQNVNKVATAVQLHHLPSGIVIRMQESKSQQQNRERAKRLLMAKLHEAEQRRLNAERTQARRSQIGEAGRSEKLRTYRYKEGIVADERLPGEYSLRDLMAGDMTRLFADLLQRETQRRLAEL